MHNRSTYHSDAIVEARKNIKKMEIIGWIRQGDKAACGGTVIDGNATSDCHGRPLSYTGAHMACRKNCVIIEGHPLTIMDGKNLVHHGHRTSNGCPLLSTLNGVDGWGNESGAPIATEYFQNTQGEWTPKVHDGMPYDEQTHVVAEHTEGVPYFIETTDGRTFSGAMPAGGELLRVDTYGQDTYTVLWGDEALAKLTGEA